LRRLYSTEL